MGEREKRRGGARERGGVEQDREEGWSKRERRVCVISTVCLIPCLIYYIRREEKGSE